MLNEQAIQEFKEAYLEVYGVRLDDKTARYKAMKLMNLYRPVYKKIPKSSRYVEKGKDYAKSNT